MAEAIDPGRRKACSTLFFNLELSLSQRRRFLFSLTMTLTHCDSHHPWIDSTLFPPPSPRGWVFPFDRLTAFPFNARKFNDIRFVCEYCELLLEGGSSSGARQKEMQNTVSLAEDGGGGVSGAKDERASSVWRLAYKDLTGRGAARAPI